MLALDFVSLLLSKEDPVQAGMTLSPALRDLVGIGVLSADKLAKSNITEARLQDHKTIATGWKFADIDKTVDSVMIAASRLQKEITVETKYWADVLAVSEKGWAITQVPNEPGNLGVRYGFSEAAPDFRNTSLAPMRRSENGTVDLDCGTVIGESKRLLVTLERHGKVVGRSSLPQQLPPEAPLESRVLEARNTIFAQELWHELNREGRLLVAQGVRLEESALSYRSDQHSRVVLSLQPLRPLPDETTPEARPEDHRAEATSVALHQLITYAHRVSNQRRSRTVAKTRNQSATTTPCPLLRPVLAQLQHEKNLDEAIRFVSGLTTVLQAAGVTTAIFKVMEPSILPQSSAARGSPSEALIRSLFGPLECQIMLNVTREANLVIYCRTSLADYLSTTYRIHVYSLADGEVNPLSYAYPPNELSNREGYTLSDLKYYLQQAITRILVERAIKAVQPDQPAPPPPQETPPLQPAWIRHISGAALENAKNEDETIAFDMAVPDHAAEGQHPELRVTGTWSTGGGGPAQQTWTWTANDLLHGIKKASVDEVVGDMFGRAAKASF